MKAKTWRLMSLAPAGEQCTSAKIKTREEALEWACQLHILGIKIVAIESSDGEILNAAEILEWCNGARLRE